MPDKGVDGDDWWKHGGWDGPELRERVPQGILGLSEELDGRAAVDPAPSTMDTDRLFARVHELALQGQADWLFSLLSPEMSPLWLHGHLWGLQLPGPGDAPTLLPT